ncbi:cysteine proteinase [Poronia punctata]|nr:cysteine proteinase [Poronia punctata]
MRSHPSDRLPNRSDFYGAYYSEHNSLWDRLCQPSVLVPFGLLLLTVFYQSLHSSSQLSPVRHPGELLWDFIVTVTPAKFLYALDSWLSPPLLHNPDSEPSPRSTSHAAKSEVLCRILGMDRPGGIMSAVTLAGRKGISSLSSVTLAPSKQLQEQPPGLGNYDNSCFQNSILQGLSSLETFPAYLARALEMEPTEGARTETSSTATLRDLLQNLTDPQNNGATLWTPRKLKSLDTWQQQDAQEYYSKLLDEIDKEVIAAAKAQNRPPGLEIAGARDDTVESQHSDDSGYHSLSVSSKSTSEPNGLRNPLEGLVAQRVACVQCGHSEGLSMIPFNCITLSLGVGQADRNLYERFDAYTDLEAIEGVECAKCTLLRSQRLLNIIVTRNRQAGLSQEDLREPLARLEAVETALREEEFDEQTLLEKCKISKQNRVSSTKTKQMVIGRPPSSLAIHFNRSVFDETTGYMFKNLAAVRFPSLLDLGPWCLGSAGARAPAGVHDQRAAQGAEEYWSTGPTRSMIAGARQTSRVSGPIYELRAVITHRGRHENGHYVCYRKHPRDSPTKESANGQTDSTAVQAGSDEGSQQNPELGNMDESAKWWRLSDETVWEVSEESVLAQDDSAFMLFYDCVDHNSLLTTEGQDDGTSDSDDQKIDEDLAQPEVRTVSGQFMGCEKSEVVIPQSELRPSPPQSTTHSSLLPLLDEDEDFEPTIPLHWPNS